MRLFWQQFWLRLRRIFWAAVSFAVVVSKGLYHQDVRQFGSGNAGMTNIRVHTGKGRSPDAGG